MVIDEIMEQWSVPWGLILQALVFISIVVVLLQIKTADTLDGMRRHAPQQHVFFSIRRAAMFIKLLSLCWAVIYGYDHGWQPWPPFVLFLMAFNVHAVMYMLILKHDIWQLRRLQGQPLA